VIRDVTGTPDGVLQKIQVVAVKTSIVGNRGLHVDVVVIYIHTYIIHAYKHTYIRKKLLKLERSNWTVAFSWVKAHAGIHGK